MNKRVGKGVLGKCNLKKLRDIVVPLIHGEYIPDTQCMPESTDSIETYIYFSYTYTPMINFNL